jgi:predicted secreted protein
MHSALAGCAFLAVAALAPVAACAGDYAELHVIGFSADRSHLAFEEFGTEDGSGYPYSTITIVETARNSFAAPPIRVRIDEDSATLEAARAEAQTRAAGTLTRLGIVAGDIGDVIVDRRPADVSGQASTEAGPVRLAFARRVVFSPVIGRYELTLTPVPATDPSCENFDNPAQMLRVTLSENGGAPVILQQDRSLPTSRGCAFAYSIHRIHWSGDRLAVFLTLLKPGFEGPDLRHMVVTGIVEDPDFKR